MKFWNKINTLHIAHQKEVAKTKGEGQAADKAADPITILLHKRLLKWSLKESNIMVWLWTQQQWNQMACLASVDPLKNTNFKLGTDSFVVKCNNSKAGKQAEQLSKKTSVPIHATGQCVARLVLESMFFSKVKLKQEATRNRSLAVA